MILTGVCRTDDILLCPSCGKDVPLPAVECPSCGAQFFLIRRKRNMRRDDEKSIAPAQAVHAV